MNSHKSEFLTKINDFLNKITPEKFKNFYTFEHNNYSIYYNEKEKNIGFVSSEITSIDNRNFITNLDILPYDESGNILAYICLYNDNFIIDGSEKYQNIYYSLETQYFKDFTEEEFFQFGLISEIVPYISNQNIEKIVRLCNMIVG